MYLVYKDNTSRGKFFNLFISFLPHQEMLTLLSVLLWGVIDIIDKIFAIVKSTMIARWGFYHKYDDYHIFPIAMIAPIGASKFLYRNLCKNSFRNYSYLFTLRYKNSEQFLFLSSMLYTAGLQTVQVKA